MKKPDYRVWFAAVWLVIVGGAMLWSHASQADDYEVLSGSYFVPYHSGEGNTSGDMK